SRWVSSPAFVRSNRPCVSASSQPIGYRRVRARTRSITVGRPCGSEEVVTYPAGLLSNTYSRSGWTLPRWPSTSMRALVASTRIPSSVAGRPSTHTRPARIRSSAARRDATPACASTFSNRSPPASPGIRSTGRSSERKALRGRGGSEGRLPDPSNRRRAAGRFGVPSFRCLVGRTFGVSPGRVDRGASPPRLASAHGGRGGLFEPAEDGRLASAPGRRTGGGRFGSASGRRARARAWGGRFPATGRRSNAGGLPFAFGRRGVGRRGARPLRLELIGGRCRRKERSDRRKRFERRQAESLEEL